MLFWNWKTLSIVLLSLQNEGLERTEVTEVAEPTAVRQGWITKLHLVLLTDL